MSLEKQSLCNIRNGCASTYKGAEAAEGVADREVRRPLHKVTLHTIHGPSPASQEHTETKGSKKGHIAGLYCKIS